MSGDQREQIPPPTVVDGPGVAEEKQETVNKTVDSKVNLNVDPITAINLNALEYDRKIREAEAVVAQLKSERAAYIYDANVKNLVAQAQAQQNQPQNPVQN